jgi:lipopolysaccharide/colanic/teichoic acid biosynthesis glycosyltransferase
MHARLRKEAVRVVRKDRAAIIVNAPFAAPPLQERHGLRRHRAGFGYPSGGLSKRIFDIGVAGALLLALSPLLLVIWTLVRLESRGPGLFRQRRGGFKGKPFFIYKFRSMTRCEDTTIEQAVRGDQRVTRLGAILRRTSLDELPQLINVCKGDMSLIGPRPHALAHDKQFAAVTPRYRVRFRARPGITGLAQVSGSRGPTETPEKIVARAELDAKYVETWSWANDLRILLTTALVVFHDPDAF